MAWCSWIKIKNSRNVQNVMLQLWRKIEQTFPIDLFMLELEVKDLIICTQTRRQERKEETLQLKLHDVMKRLKGKKRLVQKASG